MKDVRDTNRWRQDQTPGHQRPQAVVAIFKTAEAARRAAEQLAYLDLQFESVPSVRAARSGRDANDRAGGEREKQARHRALEHLSEVFFEASNHITTSDVAAGATKGAVIGAITGAVLVALPGVGWGVLVGGALGGAFIGGVAAIDEGDRAIHLPALADYRRMLRRGKSLIVVYADEAKRIEFENHLRALGAEATYQHPPVLHSIRHVGNTTSPSSPSSQ